MSDKPDEVLSLKRIQCNEAKGHKAQSQSHKAQGKKPQGTAVEKELI
jgi:hypothetical protein